MITKTQLTAAAKTVASRAPYARNTSKLLVDRRHPRGVLGRALHTAGLTPKQIASIQNGDLSTLNPAAQRWYTDALKAANKGQTWEAVAATR